MTKFVERIYLKLVLSPTVRFLGILFTLIGIVGITIVMILLSNSDFDWNTKTFPSVELVEENQFNYWLPYLIPGTLALLLFIIGIVLLLRYNFKKKRLLSLLNTQQAKDARIVQNVQNFHVTVNNVPRREITFETTDGNVYTFRFFGESVARQFQEGQTIPIITDGSKAYPAPDFFEQFEGFK